MVCATARQGRRARLQHHLPACLRLLPALKLLSRLHLFRPNCSIPGAYTYRLFIPCSARPSSCPPGEPTLLGLLYMAIAERMGLRTAAVSLPSHFLIKPLDLPGDVYIGPYNGGRLYDTQAVGRLVHRHLHVPPPEQAAAAEALRSAVTATAQEDRKRRRRAAAAASSANPVPGPFMYGYYGGDPAYGDEYDGGDDYDTAPMFVLAAAGFGAGADPWFAPYLQPVGKRQVLLRLRRNLREVCWVALVGRKVRQGVTRAGKMGPDWHEGRGLGRGP